MTHTRTANRRPPIYVGWIFSCFIACIATAVEPSRIWVDANGLFSVEARLIEIVEGRAVLHRKDGEKITIEIDKLSERDKEYLEEVERRVVQNGNSLRNSPPKPPEIKPLPILDLPEAERVAADGSALTSAQPKYANLPTAPTEPLAADPSPWTFGVPNARIAMGKVDSNDQASRPIPIMSLTRSGTRSTSIGMSVSSGKRFFGEHQINQLIRFNADDQKADVVLEHDDTIRLMDHHVGSNRSLVLVGFNSLGEGGELAIATGWDDGQVKLSHRRRLSDKRRGMSPAQLRWARWVDEEHFIAVIDQTLGLWNIVSGQQIYRIDQIDHRAKPAISGGRRYVAVPYEGAVVLFATATGNLLGRIDIEQRVPSVRFSPQGNQLAVVTSRRLRIWDLPSAKLTADMDVRRSLGRSGPIWIDSDLVLSSSGVLLSVFRGVPIWRYDIAGTEAVAIGKHVVMFRTHPVTELSIVSLPHDAASNAIDWIDKSPAKVDEEQWRVLGRSVWSDGGWADRDVQISAAPDRLR